MENSEVPPPFKVWNSVPMILQLRSRVSHITVENVDLIQDSYLQGVSRIFNRLITSIHVPVKVSVL